MKKKFKQHKRYYYLFAYKFQLTNGKEGYGGKTISKSNINITQSTFNYIVESIKKNVDGADNIIITSVSYLGYMTEKEFYDEP